MPTIPPAVVPNNQAGPLIQQFSGSVESALAGESVFARANFLIPNSLDASAGTISYEILDADGIVFTFGVGNNYNVLPGTTGDTAVVADANIAIPTDIPTSTVGTKYLLRWLLEIPGEKDQYLSETFLVLPNTQTAVNGPEDVVALYNDEITIQITLPRLYQFVKFEIYKGNNVVKILADTDNMAAPEASQNGYTYRAAVTGTFVGAQPQLVPFTVNWKYYDGTKSPNRDSSKLFLVTPTIIDAAKDVQGSINKAYINMGITPDATFTMSEILGYLRQGADNFNAVQVLTYFTMTDATGAVRSCWINYSKVVGLQAQQLAEGNKAFNFGSQAVTLDVDKTQYFESLASTIQGNLDAQVPNIKHALVKYGLSGGSGNINAGARAGHIGAIGISVHPASNLRNIQATLGNFSVGNGQL